MKKILFISVGGLVSDETAAGEENKLTTEELFARVDGLSELCEADVICLEDIRGADVSMRDWIKTAELIRDLYNRYDGFVVCHPLDNICYSAVALSYLVQNSSKPIIFTGARIPLMRLDTDAKNNLKDSFTCACSPDLKGVFTVLWGDVILANRAKRIRAVETPCVFSINAPKTAVVTDDGVSLCADSAPSAEITGEPLFYNKLNPGVAVLKVIPGMKADVLKWYLSTNDAVIIEGCGVGSVPLFEGEFEVIAKAACENGKIIAMATSDFYDGTDMESDAEAKRMKESYRIIEIYDMTCEAALAKLMWLTCIAKDRDEAEKMFYAPVYGDIRIKSEINEEKSINDETERGEEL